LVLHRIIKTKRIPKDIDDVCEYISTKEREIAKCVWDLEDRIYARYASKHIGQDFQAIISDVDEHPCVEFISNIAGLKADVINYESQSLFSKVDVRIEQSDVVTKVIKVKII
jgi:ribonuclease R